MNMMNIMKGEVRDLDWAHSTETVNKFAYLINILRSSSLTIPSSRIRRRM